MKARSDGPPPRGRLLKRHCTQIPYRFVAYMKRKAFLTLPILLPLLLPLLASSFFLPTHFSPRPPAVPSPLIRWTGGEESNVGDLVGKERLKRFLEDASFLGPIR
ncbi:hypothetical protein Naga_101971g1 [Nannochloropsis gaditana]|uniref:Uncharacterized protein n=1 Tax=Nannochloropsis gaditana TaxID=72520 RepID=W7SZM4_9STRA|nr:hypothetical protein Naga_101971g1 [Nannochloropsis gaditana]